MFTPKYIILKKDGQEIANLFYNLDNLILLQENFTLIHTETTAKEVVYEIN